MALPARDEAGSITAAVAALATQRALDGSPLATERYEVLVLANNCTDRTIDVVQHAAADLRRHVPGFCLHVVASWLAPGEAHSGGARRRAMDLAWQRLHSLGPMSDGTPRIVATTDADTTVAPDWIAATLAEIANGADAVGGRVTAASLTDVPAAARALYLYDAGYHHLVARLHALVDPDPHDPWPRHHQHFGASLAATVSAYARAGGMPATESLEDVHFHDALVRAGLRVRHSGRVRARTSVRALGRARVGLATQIAEWETAGGRWSVESAALVEGWARTRAGVRRLWATRGTSDVAASAAALCLTPDVLRHEAAISRPFGAFVLDADLRRRFAREWGSRRAGTAYQDVRAAVRTLRSRVAALEITDR